MAGSRRWYDVAYGTAFCSDYMIRGWKLSGGWKPERLPVPGALAPGDWQPELAPASRRLETLTSGRPDSRQPAAANVVVASTVLCLVWGFFSSQRHHCLFTCSPSTRLEACSSRLEVCFKGEQASSIEE